MWNDKTGGKVSKVDHGKGVKVSEFGGEGTGLKSMRDFNWKEGQDIKFTVEGRRVNSVVKRAINAVKRTGKETW